MGVLQPRARSLLITSNPDMRGKPMSRMIRQQGSDSTRKSAVSPSLAQSAAWPVPLRSAMIPRESAGSSSTSRIRAVDVLPFINALDGSQTASEAEAIIERYVARHQDSLAQSSNGSFTSVGLGLEYQQPGAQDSTRGGRNVEPIALFIPHAGASAERRDKFTHVGVMISVYLLHDAQESLAPGNINALSAGIVEHVIHVPRGGEAGDDLARVHVENRHPRRLAGADEDPAIRLIQHHREVRRVPIGQSPGQHLSRGAVDDLYVLGIGDVDEDSGALRLELKPFRMSFEFVHGGKALVGRRIYDPNGPFAISDVDLLGRCVVAQIVRVGVLAEVDRVDQREFRAVIDIHMSVRRIGNKELVPLRQIQCALRFGQSVDLMGHTSGKHIDDLHRVIAEPGEDHALALAIDREVIQATLNAGQRYFLNFAHRGCLALLGLSGRAQSGQGPGTDQETQQMTI